MIIFVILLFLLLTPWELRLDFGSELKLSLGKFGLFYPLPRTSGRKEGLGEILWEKLVLYEKLYREGGIGVTTLFLELEIGTGDAAATALVVGWLWALEGALVPFLPWKNVFSAKPLYGSGAIFKARGRCIFRLVPGYIIIVWLKNLWRLYLKGGD